MKPTKPANEESNRVNAEKDGFREVGRGEGRICGTILFERFFEQQENDLAEIRNQYPDPEERSAAEAKYFQKKFAGNLKRRKAKEPE